jgi:hypothetical protein
MALAAAPTGMAPPPPDDPLVIATRRAIGIVVIRIVAIGIVAIRIVAIGIVATGVVVPALAAAAMAVATASVADAGSDRHGAAAASWRATFSRADRVDNHPASPAQPPTATPGVPPGPPLQIGGEWSITRSYWRSCPHCGTVIVRTVPWVITQSGADVQVNRGLRGTVTGSGPALLSLEGTETGGFDAQRFWYATLRVAADGRSFEGAFNGSERISNPCGSEPPEVTCLVSAGWVRGVLVEAASVPPTDTPVPTATAVPTVTETPRPLPPVRSQPSATALATRVMGVWGAGPAFLPALELRRR